MSGEAVGFGADYLGQKVGMNPTQRMIFGIVASMGTAKGLDMADAKFNVSGLYTKASSYGGMSVEDAQRYNQFMDNGSQCDFTNAEKFGSSKLDEINALKKVDCNELIKTRELSLEDRLYQNHWDDLLKGKGEIPPGFTKAEYSKYLFGNSKLNEINALKKVDFDEIINLRQLEAQKVGKAVEGGSEYISNLLKKTTCSNNELYKYISKNVGSDAAEIFIKTGSWPDCLQIPKNSSVINTDGSVSWTKAPEGGYTLKANGKANKDPFVPKIGEVVDRYGSANGRYTSPVVNGKSYAYTQRSLPYIEDPLNYHQYEVTGDFSKIEEYVNKCTDAKLKSQIDAAIIAYYDGNYSNLISYKGNAAAVEGWGAGGAVQYEFSLTVEQFERLGLLKEIK